MDYEEKSKDLHKFINMDIKVVNSSETNENAITIADDDKYHSSYDNGNITAGDIENSVVNEEISDRNALLYKVNEVPPVAILFSVAMQVLVAF